MVALNELCYDGNFDEVSVAIALGSDVNDKDRIGQTSLMRAIVKRHNAIVKLLLDQPGVRVNEKTDDNSTALHRAVSGNNPDGARMLLLHPDMNTANSVNTFGETALQKAVKERKVEVLRELVKHKRVDLDIGDTFQRSKR